MREINISFAKVTYPVGDSKLMLISLMIGNLGQTNVNLPHDR
jgi:hypothetical protein